MTFTSSTSQDRRTQKFTREGHFIQAWGVYTREIASSPNGNVIYLTSGWIDADQAIYSSQGQYVGGTRFNLNLVDNWRFFGRGIDVGPDNTIYVSLSDSGKPPKIALYSSTGLEIRKLEAPSFGKIAVDNSGNLYLAGINRQVYKIRIDDGWAYPFISIGFAADIVVGPDAQGIV